MRTPLQTPIFLLLLWLSTTLAAKPKPSDVYREHIWLPDMVRETAKFLRVGGSLDYHNPDNAFPHNYLVDGALILEDSLDLEDAIRAEVTLKMVQSHKDTKGLALRINQKDRIPVPELPGLPRPQSDYMFHAYPTVQVPVKQLKAGTGNTFELRVDSLQKWACPRHIFYSIIFRIYYNADYKPHAGGTIQGVSQDTPLMSKLQLLKLDDPGIHRTVENRLTPGIEDKMVHGMEVQYPGPMVEVKYHSLMPEGIRITEGYYQGRPHFIVHTPGAIYYYDKAGGGFSRMIDRTGEDWISFRPEPWGEYPASAASAFRGIPNLVHGTAEAGAGHPGHEQCSSEQTGANKIRTTSGSGVWQWEWTFEPGYARLDILRVSPDAPYWFLYEGTPGGVFDPQRQFFGTDKGGPLYVQPDFYKEDKVFDYWQWAYFGHDDCEALLFIAQAEPDTLTDTFSYLGHTGAGISSTDGMTVFGFGRADGARPLLTKINTFYLGFLDRKADNRHLHRKARRSIKTILKAN